MKSAAAAEEPENVLRTNRTGSEMELHNLGDESSDVAQKSNTFSDRLRLTFRSSRIRTEPAHSPMANEIACWFLVRLLLPLSLLIACCLQFDVISLVYLILLLICPTLPSPSRLAYNGSLGVFLKACVALTILAMLPAVGFQIVLASMPPYGHFLENCEFLETLLRHLGLISLRDVSVLTLVFYVVARLLPALVALVTLRECRQLLGQYREGGEGLTVSHPLLSPSSDRRSTHNDGLKYCIVTFLTLVSLAAAAVARPSLVCALYLLVLMGAMSWWSCARQLGRPFGVLCRLLMVYSGLHVIALYLYQMQWPQQLLAPQSLAARLIGLVDIRVTNCTGDPRSVWFAAHTVDVYLYPILVYLLYYMLAMESRIILTARLVTAVGLDPGYQSMGNVVTPGEETVTGIEDDLNIGKMWDRVSTVIYACWNALTSASFLAAYIVMMYWSIKFHSWPTLVFLVWALLVAVVRNQRRVMYRSCPLLVVYAQLLVLVQYAFSLDLTATELPDTLHGFSLHDVVLRPAAYPCQTLALQLVFTSVFWMTLRQYLSEGHGASASSTTTQDPSRHRRVSLDDGFLKRCLSALMSLVVRLWIVLLAVLLFVYGVGQGQEVNLIQIIYMAFFLFFVCLFQISFRLWRRLLYGFVTVLILYQMTVLVCIYLYQFDQVNTWLAELGVSKQWQHSIGLEVYDTGRLFVKLLFPTMFMIVCVIYAQHVHPEFMSITDFDNVSRMASPMPPSAGAQDAGVPAAEPERPVSAMESAIQQQPPPPQRTVSVQSNSDMLGVLPEGLLEIPTGTDEPQIDEQADLTEMSHWLLVLLARIWNSFAVILDRSLWLVCRLIEIHSIKANILAVVLAAVLDVCAVHTLLILLACITLQLGGRGRQLISSLMLCWVSLLMMLRVVYQMNIVPSHLVTVDCTWNVTLENSSEVVAAVPDDVVVDVVEVDEDLRSYSSVENSTDDALVWLGVEKRSDLLQYLAGYIAVLVVFTIHKCVRVRGKYVARRTGHVLESGVVFSSVTRAEADADIFSMMKYLVNYGFYKFGVELCLIALVTLIASRLDVVALLYVVWLCALFSLHRGSLARVWPGFVVFIALLVCLQYLICLGLPPVLCINYPFVGHISSRLRMWLFLPDYLEPPHADLLIADVFLLLLVSCQKQVFYTEMSEGDDYPGGSNKPVSDAQLKNGYSNPVPDYNATKGDYLDVLKRVLFFSSFWLTLAVVFLAGTSRITLFSLLYVVSAFVFLWKGNDFYLLPHRDIRRRWLLLLTYNVVSIAVKSTALQVMGCLFLPFFTKNACWLAQLLGVGCLTLRRLQSSDLVPDVDDTCRVPHEEAGLLWDGLVFTCLILQLRFYTSHYFQHLVEETRAQQILANCGAALIRRELKKKIQQRRAEEEQAMGDIQNKMERIKEQRIVKKRQKYENHYRVIHSCAAEDLEMDLQRETVRRRSRVSPRPSTDAERAISPSELLMTGLTRDLNQAARHATRVRTQSGRSTGGGRIGGATGVRTGSSTGRSTSPGGSRYRTRSGDSTERTPTSSLRRRRPQLERARSHYTPAGAAGGRVGVSRMQSEPPGGCPPLPTVHSQDSTAELLPESGRTTPDPQQDESISAELPQERVDVEAVPNENAISNLIRRLILAMKASGHFSLEMMASVVISVTSRLNDASEDYRFIARQLAHKKRRLKMAWRARGGSSHTGSSSEPASTSAAAPAGSGYSPLPSTSMMAEDDAAVAPPVSLVTELAPLVSLDSDDTSHQLPQPVNRRSFDHKLRKACGDDYADDELVEEDVSSAAVDVRTSSAHRIIEQLAVAVWYAMVSNSELVAYIVVFINQLVSASILSLPLPLMVFLWGSLSVPRPSKTFWVTMIAYVETVIIIKYMFQFEFFPWNQVDKGNAPFWPPRILGIEQRDHYALYDLILLLIIFFHRLVLMTLGLWKDVEDDDLFADSAGKLAELKASNDAALNGLETSVQPDGGVVEASAGALALIPDATVDHLAPERKTAAERSREVATRAKNEMVEGFKYYMSAVKEFFVSLIFDASKEKVDVYAYMFFCDFINIFVIFMGFSSFGPPQGAGGGDISSVVEDNKVPIPFLIILSLNFLLILADRGIYLRKSIMWKVIFQYLLVFMLHGWLFFILPAMTGREFSQALAPQVWYMIKCVYLLFSAYQIRSGYPTRILGNFLTKQYTVINKTAFRCFMIIPFLYELRALMDWLWTKTSLDIFNWLKMEDIYAHIFISKCQRVQEESEVYVSGEPRRSHEKCLLGGGWLVMIVAVIFAPLVLFALSNAVGIPNPPREVQLELSLASYERLFQIRTGQNGIHGIDEIMYNTINYQYRSDRAAQGFLGDYDYTDITTIKMSGHSTAVWAISPPAQRRMADDLAGNASMSMLLSWNIRRLHETKGVSALSAGSREFQLPAYTAKGTRNPLRDKLVRMLRGEESAEANVTLTNMFPKFLRVTNQGKAELPEGLEDPRGSRGENNQPTDYRNLIIRLVRDNSTDQQWWQLSEDCSDGLYDWVSKSCDFLEVLLFNQRAFPSTLSFITGAGIIGTYTTFVLLIGRLCRSSFVDISFHIMFDDMPYVDRILQICEDIYLVRERGNLILEEELFAKLIFLYRSPEMLIKYTEPPRPDELDDVEADADQAGVPQLQQ